MPLRQKIVRGNHSERVPIGEYEYAYQRDEKTQGQEDHTSIDPAYDPGSHHRGSRTLLNNFRALIEEQPLFAFFSPTQPAARVV